MGESTGERIKASPAQQGLTLALIFGLSGQVMIDVSDEHFELASGDSIHFDAAQAHCWRNQGDDVAILIWSRVLSQLER
jgi:quercetin dioxygenase-like cupin family protein